jgi:hypothetical protein
MARYPVLLAQAVFLQRGQHGSTTMAAYLPLGTIKTDRDHLARRHHFLAMKAMQFHACSGLARGVKQTGDGLPHTNGRERTPERQRISAILPAGKVRPSDANQ